MAVNKPVGDNARKGAVKKRSQLQTTLGGATAWTKRSKNSGAPRQENGGQKIQGRSPREKIGTVRPSRHLIHVAVMAILRQRPA
jgi:hypothetical protein